MSTNEQTIIVWFRSDLRIEDNPALSEAAKDGRVIPVFIWSPEEEDMSPGSATRWWLHPVSYTHLTLPTKGIV